MGETKIKDGGITLIKGGTKPLKLNPIQANKSTITNLPNANQNTNNPTNNHHNLTTHHTNHKAHLIPNPTNNHILNIKEDINTQIVDLIHLKAIKPPLRTNLT
ncbi:hypothetical protein AHAS_Ahas06G0166400 [Arachis hypogaea]